ncbi:MAG: hypothetical protein ACI9H8_001687 [Lysobacterales bacterium]
MITPEVQLGSILHPLIERLAPRRTLTINAGAKEFTTFGAQSDGLLVKVEIGRYSGKPSVRCNSRNLPFEGNAFNMIMLNHMYGMKEAADILELRRVLAGGGNLIIIGRGRYGSVTDIESPKTPLFDYKSICRLLRQQGFQISQCEGFGFRGRQVHWEKNWQMVALPLADLIMIRAKYSQNSHIVTPIRFGQVNLSREAV